MCFTAGPDHALARHGGLRARVALARPDVVGCSAGRLADGRRPALSSWPDGAADATAGSDRPLEPVLLHAAPAGHDWRPDGAGLVAGKVSRVVIAGPNLSLRA